MVYIADVDLLQADSLGLMNISFGDFELTWSDGPIAVKGWNPGLRLPVEISVSYDLSDVIEFSDYTEFVKLELVVRFFSRQSMTRKTLIHKLDLTTSFRGIHTFETVFDEGETFGPMEILYGVVASKSDIVTKRILVENSQKVSMGGSKGGLNVVWEDIGDDSFWKFSFTTSQDLETLVRLSHHTATEIALNSKRIELIESDRVIQGLLFSDFLFHVVDWMMHLDYDCYLELVQIISLKTEERKESIGTWVQLLIASIGLAEIRLDENSPTNWEMDKHQVKNRLQNKAMRIKR